MQAKNRINEKIYPHPSLSTNQSAQFRFYSALRFHVLILSLFFVSCGGGTSGTGGGLDVSGVLRAPEGPLGGVQVSITNEIARDVTGAAVSKTNSPFSESRTILTDVTDAEGNFLLALDSRPTAFTLKFRSDEIDAEFPVINIPENSTDLILELEYDRSGNLIVEIEEKFEDSEGEELREHEKLEQEALTK